MDTSWFRGRDETRRPFNFLLHPGVLLSHLTRGEGLQNRKAQREPHSKWLSHSCLHPAFRGHQLRGEPTA